MNIVRLCAKIVLRFRSDMARQKYALVKFKPFGREYTYSCGDDVQKGNVVLVGVGLKGEQKHAIVTDVCYFAEGALPCEESKIQPILEIVSERDFGREFFEDVNKLFALEEPRMMNALWSRAENYDEYQEELPLYGDIEHKSGGRITVFKTPISFVIRYSIRDFAEGRQEVYGKVDMLAVTKNLKCGIDFYMRHRDAVPDEFIEELFENPTVIPHIFQDDEDEFFEDEFDE